MQNEEAIAKNKLGIQYYKQQQWEAAIEAYQSAIDLAPHYVDAYYNLGLALRNAQHTEEAFSAFEAVLALYSTHMGAQFQLGCLLMAKNAYQKAISYFNLITKQHPPHLETLTNLATCYLKLSNVAVANTYYLQALALAPDDPQILFNLGVISFEQGLVDDAIRYYLRALALNNDNVATHNNLAKAYLTNQDKAKALLHFREALRIQPNNLAIQHTINIITQENKVDKLPADYIKSLFDSYADHYDTHLMHTLHYQTPALFYKLIVAMIDKQQSLDIADLGCGTGLCGELFKPMAASMVGVDLSEKMLSQAARKDIYNDLVQADVIDFLRQKNDAYDVILAGDLLVYMGDLADLFAAAYQALRSDGLFVFNTEISVEVPYHMTESGRFSHHEHYIEQLALRFHFAVLVHETVTLRMQNYDPVPGHLYLLRKLC